MDSGAPILGHNHAGTRDAVLAQAARGWNFGLPGADQLELARLIQAAAPANERVMLCNAEGEALAAAVAAARAVTGRGAIAAFAAPGGAPCADHTQGTLGQGAIGHLPYGEAAALDIIAARRSDLAAVIVEPVRADDPDLGHVAWLQGLIEACNTWAVPVIFDESLTGFRLAFGGAQELLGLIPDLVVYGKAVGGGLPLAALAGRAEVMASVGRGEKAFGEWAGNPISIAAGPGDLARALSRARGDLSQAQCRRRRAGRGLQPLLRRGTHGRDHACGRLHVPADVRAGRGRERVLPVRPEPQHFHQRLAPRVPVRGAPQPPTWIISSARSPNPCATSATTGLFTEDAASPPMRLKTQADPPRYAARGNA